MKKMIESAQSIIKNCLETKKDESVLVLYHSPYQELANIFYAESIKRSVNTFQLQIPENFYKQNINSYLSSMMNQMDVIIAITFPSISFWNNRIKANQNGSRIICLPNITDASFARISKTNFKRIHYLSKKLSDILSISKNVQISSPNGTNIQFSITNHEGFAETGLVNSKGTFSILPAGEACIVPESCEGEFVVDSGLDFNLEDPDKLVIHIKEGRAVRVSGGSSAKRLRQKFSKMGTHSRNILEFGIGTNETLKNNGNPLEDQKVFGNVHITMGQFPTSDTKLMNMYPIHEIAYKATVELRGKKIIDRGKLMLDV